MTHEITEVKYYDKWLETIPELVGKVVAVTGTTSGTGHELALAAIQKKVSTLISLNRPSAKADAAQIKFKEAVEAAAGENEPATQLIQVDCDLMSFDSVRAAAAEVNKICEEIGGLNVLCNNAGIMMFPAKITADGFDVQMQTNHLSHFLLTKLLMPSFVLAIESGQEVRIVQHSSDARRILLNKLEEKYFDPTEKGGLGGDGVFHSFKRYAMSKLSNTVFSQMLAKQVVQRGFDPKMFKCVSAEPGICSSDLTSGIMSQRSGAFYNGFFWVATKVLDVAFGQQSTKDGSLCIIESCFGENVDNGDHFRPAKQHVGDPLKVISKGEFAAGSKRQEKGTLDEANQELLWRKSEQVLGPFFEQESN